MNGITRQLERQVQIVFMEILQHTLVHKSMRLHCFAGARMSGLKYMAYKSLNLSRERSAVNTSRRPITCTRVQIIKHWILWFWLIKICKSPTMLWSKQTVMGRVGLSYDEFLKIISFRANLHISWPATTLPLTSIFNFARMKLIIVAFPWTGICN